MLALLAAGSAVTPPPGTARLVPTHHNHTGHNDTKALSAVRNASEPVRPMQQEQQQQQQQAEEQSVEGAQKDTARLREAADSATLQDAVGPMNPLDTITKIASEKFKPEELLKDASDQLQHLPDKVKDEVKDSVMGVVQSLPPQLREFMQDRLVRASVLRHLHHPPLRPLRPASLHHHHHLAFATRLNRVAPPNSLAGQAAQRAPGRRQGGAEERPRLADQAPRRARRQAERRAAGGRRRGRARPAARRSPIWGSNPRS